MKIIFIAFVFFFRGGFSIRLDAQREELRRQYFDYLGIFKKREQPSSFETFLENLSRISYRKCDNFIDKTSDEVLTYTNCSDKE